MNINYALRKITETEFRFNYDFDYRSFDPKELGFQLGQNIKAELNENLLKVSFTVVYIYSDNEIELARNSVCLDFYLDPINDVIKLDENDNVITGQEDLIDTFLNITIGTLRGIMMKNLKNTPLEQYYLPLIPRKFFQKLRKES
ncbi:MAG: hypothetical protein IKH58_09895 [Bacteroidales bacterium]|nr:hypothetical protein [Bacteroidales bacterium]